MNEKISLQDLSVLLSDKAKITKKDAEIFLREYFEILNEDLIKSGFIKVKDLGTFKLSLVDNRESIDVTTGERMLIPSHYKVIFTPDKKLAEIVNEPFAFFETTEIDDDSSLEELKYFPEENASEEAVLEEIVSEEIVLEEIVSEENASEEIAPKNAFIKNAVDEGIVTEEVISEKISNEDVSNNNVSNSDVANEKIILEGVASEEVISKEFVSDGNIHKEIIEEQPDTSVDKCLDCRDHKAYQNYRKKYFKAQKKIKCLRIAVYALFALLVFALGYIACLKIFALNILKFF